MNKFDSFDQLEVTSRQQWRDWLMDHHASSDGIWLVTYKKHCEEKHLPYGDTVEEALCFGWIDSLRRRVDDERSMIVMTPRKPGSGWSGLNKERIAALKDAGLITPAGKTVIDAAIADGSWTFLDDIEAMIVPPDLADAFAASSKAAEHYAQFSNSAKRGLLWWIKSAKRASTRADRIQKTVVAAAQGKIATQPES